MNDSSSGTQFDFTYAPGTSTEQMIGFEMAGEIWSSYLTDDVTIRIHVESTSELPDEVVGAALPGKKKKEKYDKIYDALEKDITSSDDRTAFANLPSEDKEFSVLINGQELDKTKEFRVTNANAKSLDLLNDDRKKLDGYIVVNDLAENSAVGWDYDALRSDNTQGNEIDFLSVAMHEVGHVLGFVSGVDDSDWLKVLTESQEDEDKNELKDKDFKFASPLDLYRYSDSSAASGQIDLSFGGNPFFSIDGGNTKLGTFANGQYTDFGGDGYQASHWDQFSSQGIMDPVLPVGLRKDISSLDVTSMDVIGWDVNTAAAPSWDEMYASAVADANGATIEDREKDVEKMIQESSYEVRRSRGVRSRIYSWQIGLWQYTTLDPTDVSEVVTVEEFADTTDVGDTDNDSTNNQPDIVTPPGNNDGLPEDSNEAASGDLQAIDDINPNNTDSGLISTQPEQESLGDNDLSSDSEVILINEPNNIDNENTENYLVEYTTEIVETPSVDDSIGLNIDSDVVDVDNSPIISDTENSSADNQPESIEPSDNNSSDNSDNVAEDIAESETNITTDGEDSQIEANNQSIAANDDDEGEDDDDDDNVFISDYWQEPQQLTAGVGYYGGEQDSLIEYS